MLESQEFKKGLKDYMAANPSYCIRGDDGYFIAMNEEFVEHHYNYWCDSSLSEDYARRHPSSRKRATLTIKDLAEDLVWKQFHALCKEKVEVVTDEILSECKEKARHKLDSAASEYESATYEALKNELNSFNLNKLRSLIGAFALDRFETNERRALQVGETLAVAQEILESDEFQRALLEARKNYPYFISPRDPSIFTSYIEEFLKNRRIFKHPKPVSFKPQETPNNNNFVIEARQQPLPNPVLEKPGGRRILGRDGSGASDGM
ncbi:hypothetical protein T439DRAFT_383364 [Meredithblackwellia eburnea MCA 4105]